MTRIRRDLNGTGCCNSFRNGIRTINGQYPDDNRDFDINAGAGILITPATGGIIISNTGDTQSFIEGTNIKFTPNGDDLEIGMTDDVAIVNDLSVGGDTTLNGDLNVNGNIYNQGASYESHMEQVYTEDDYIIMRDNAVTGLGSGDFSGFQVKLYDGVKDGRLVIDNSGTARVGDVGDEQPLLTRDESADLTDGAILKWDAANMKAVDEGTVGDDTHPVKIVNGVATQINWIDQAVTITPNTYFVSSISRGEVRFDGRFVRGFIRLKMNGIPANTEVALVTLSKTAKYPYGNGNVSISVQGKTGITWVDGSGYVKYYGTSVVSSNDEIAITICFEPN